ncbi:MAG: EFR1 family ferrodoxin [Chitinispirillaceae bacterium]|nr:EFR1 family ferrodoxin [Chitinispirillaceae bacterium]
MTADIYYFTSTGNSLEVARHIAERLNGRLIPIASLMEEKIIAAQADVIGIVFPVYYVDLPALVRKFAEKLVNIDNNYLFAVCTYGGGVGGSLTSLNRIVLPRVGRLSAMFGVHMPQNAFSKPFENQPKILRRSEKKIDAICRSVNSRKNGMPFSDRAVWAMLFPFQLLAKAAFRSYLVKCTGTPDQSNEDMIRLLDKGFGTNAKCTGCGTCSRVCPVDNIRIEDNKPVWLHHCETCLACYHWCPENAIYGGVAPKNGYRYRHPEVSVADVMRQKIHESPHTF